MEAKRLTDEELTEIWTRVADADVAALEGHLAALVAQLPEGMKHCTIVSMECALGHGWLTATNWVQHGCPTCALRAAEAERDAARQELERQLGERAARAVAMEVRAVTAEQSLRTAQTEERAARVQADTLQAPLRELVTLHDVVKESNPEEYARRKVRAWESARAALQGGQVHPTPAAPATASEPAVTHAALAAAVDKYARALESEAERLHALGQPTLEAVVRHRYGQASGARAVLRWATHGEALQVPPVSRIHEGDWSSHVLKTGDWEHVKLPAVAAPAPEARPAQGGPMMVGALTMQEAVLRDPWNMAPISVPTTVEPTEDPDTFIVSVDRSVFPEPRRWRFADGAEVGMAPDGTLLLPPESEWPRFFDGLQETDAGLVGVKRDTIVILMPKEQPPEVVMVDGGGDEPQPYVVPSCPCGTSVCGGNCQG